MGRRQLRQAKVGDYRQHYWESKLNPTIGRWGDVLVRQAVAQKPHPEESYASQGVMLTEWKILTSEELLNADLSVANSDPGCRAQQAAELERAEYHGPIGGGEARVLKSIFTELGMPDLVKRGWVDRNVMVMAPPSQWHANQQPPGKRRTKRLQKCYLFKSPLENVPFEKWIKLGRMYKEGKELRGAIKALLANPDARKEIDTVDALEILGGMKGMD